MRCLNCGFENEADSQFCEKCGKPLANSGQEPSFFCPECGTENSPDALFCEGCGLRFGGGTAEETPPKKSKKPLIVIGILAVIVVCLGIGAGAFFVHKKKESERREIAEAIEDMEKQAEEDEEEQDAEEEAEKDEAEKEEDIEEAEEEAEEEPKAAGQEAAETPQPPQPVQVQAPAITMQNISGVYATSELAEANMVHSASRIMDGDKNTAWVEGADGQGYGQAIRFDFNNVYLVSGIRIRSGYHKNDDIYYKNSRPKEISITYSNGGSEILRLEDAGLVEQVVMLSQPVETSMVNLVIESVYPGGKYEDTCISEITFF